MEALSGTEDRKKKRKKNVIFLVLVAESLFRSCSRIFVTEILVPEITS